MKRIRRLIAAWSQTPQTVVINVTGSTDPIATGKAVHRALVELKRRNGGTPLGLS